MKRLLVLLIPLLCHSLAHADLVNRKTVGIEEGQHYAVSVSTADKALSVHWDDIEGTPSDIADGDQVGEAGSGASDQHNFVLIGSTNALTNERYLAAGTGLSLTDGGAGGAATMGIDPGFVPSSATYAETASNSTLFAGHPYSAVVSTFGAQRIDGNIGLGKAYDPSYRLDIDGYVRGNSEWFFGKFSDYTNSAYFLDPAATGTGLNIAGSAVIGASVTVANAMSVGGVLTPAGGIAAGSYMTDVKVSSAVYANSVQSITLAQVQAACSNDFHNIGGTDATGSGSGEFLVSPSTGILPGTLASNVVAQSLASGSYVNDVRVSSAMYATAAATVITDDDQPDSDAEVPNNITLDNITQITTRSHTSLSDIGTRTHAALETEIDNVRTSTTTIAANLATEITNRTNADALKRDLLLKVSLSTETVGSLSASSLSDAVVNLQSVKVGTATTAGYAVNAGTSVYATDAGTLDGQHASAFALTSHNQAASTITDAVANLQSVKVGSATVAGAVPASGVTAGPLPATVYVSSVAVNSVRRESIKDIPIDASYSVCGATTTAGTNAFRITGWMYEPCTISTVTVNVCGGTNVVGMIEQRSVNAAGSAGTDVWSGDVTAVTLPVGGTFGDATVPGTSAVPYALFFVPTSWSGAVVSVEFKGRMAKD